MDDNFVPGELFETDLTRTAGLIPDGPHQFRVTSYESKMGPKAPYWAYTLTVEEGSELDGGLIFYNVSLSPNSRWKMEEWLDAVGAPETGKVIGSQFVGALIVADVTNSTSYYEEDGVKKSRRRNDLNNIRSGSSGDSGISEETSEKQVQMPEDVTGKKKKVNF